MFLWISNKNARTKISAETENIFPEPADYFYTVIIKKTSLYTLKGIRGADLIG